MRDLTVAAVMMAAMAMGMTATTTEVMGQTTPSCVSSLYACKGDPASPSAACCAAVKEEAKSDLKCLCSVLSDPSILRSLNVTADQARQLASACGVSDDLSSCFAPKPSPSAPPSKPPSSTDKGDGHKENWIGMFGFLSLSLVCWSIVIS